MMKPTVSVLRHDRHRVRGSRADRRHPQDGGTRSALPMNKNNFVDCLAMQPWFAERSKAWAITAMLLVNVMLGGCGRNTKFPNQPITLICPWSAGGGTDRVSRQVATQLEEELGVPVNVINATGGSGVTGHTRGAQALPDGHTVTMITVELSMLHWRGLTSITHRDFAPLELLNRDAAALVVREDSPWRNLDELQADIAARPRELKASGTAYGGIWHVALAGWLDSRGLDPTSVNWISINGSGPSLQELNAGGVDMVCCSLPEADALLAGGTARSLGLMADERLAGFDEVPTFSEQGHEWSIAGWRGLAAPRDTPPERLEVLARAMEKISASQTLWDFMHSAGFKLDAAGPESFEQTLVRQDELFRAILTGPAFSSMSGEHFGPMIFPGTIAVFLLLTLGCVAWQHARLSSLSNQYVSEPRPESARPGASDYLPAIAVVVVSVFYVLAAETLGFVITAALVVGGLLAAFRVRLLPAAGLGILISVVVYQAFAIGLRVPLPRGIWGW